MKPRSIYQVVTYTAVLGSIIYSPLLWDPFFSGFAVEWDEFPVALILTLPIAFLCLVPFYGLLRLFQFFNLKQIPYDGWQLQAFAFIVYSFFIFYFQRELKDLFNWYLAYYPVGITYFIWYRRLKSRGKLKSS